MAYTYNVNNLTNLGQLKKLAQRTKTELDALALSMEDAIKYATYSDNTLSLFTSSDGTGTAAFEFNLPEEMFLDQAHTSFVGSFAWSNVTYPGSTNPNLEGKPVMVLAVKGDDTNPNYSFIDMTSLVDTYTAADDSIVVSGYTIGVKIDSTAGNALTLVSGKGLRVDISGKMDKPSSATEGNVAKFDANKNAIDSGIAAADLVTKVSGGTADNLAALDSNGKMADSGIAKGDVVTKVASGTANDFVLLDANGKIKDAGYALATDQNVEDMIHDVWGDPEPSGT